MKRMKHNKRSVGKVVAGVLIGSVVGATVGWLTAPASGVEMRRRLTGLGTDARRSVQEKMKTAEGNVESKVRELKAEVDEHLDEGRKAISRRRKAASV